MFKRHWRRSGVFIVNFEEISWLFGPAEKTARLER